MNDLSDLTGASASPFDCVILVHPAIPRLDRAFNEIVHPGRCPGLDVGKELSSALLDVPLAERTRAARRWFEQQIDARAPGPLACTHIDILFLPALELDPLAMFCQAARRTKLVVLWPGDRAGNTLSYATPGHAHYHAWEIADPAIKIIRLDD